MSDTEQKYIGSVRNPPNLERVKLPDTSSQWLANSTTPSPVASMDTDDGRSKEDFVSEMEVIILT